MSASVGLKVRLSLMMFLEFFIWGAWFPLVFGYLPSMGYDPEQQAWILGMFNLAALVALFFSTQFADRNFAAQKFLAFSQLVGGCAMIGLAFIEKPEGESAPFWPFLILMAIHSLFYVPTISIANSIAFANLKDPQKEFGVIRVWGTIGWIAAAWPFVFILVDWSKVPAFMGVMKGQVGFVDWLRAALGSGMTGKELLHATKYTFVAAGFASLALAAFSLALPHTPPKPASEGGGNLAWLEAVKLLGKPFVLVLFFLTFLDAGILQTYFYWTGTYLREGVGIPSNWVMPIMSIGQVAEIVTMLVLGYVLKRLGWRFTMVIGILGHALRFAAFAFLPYAGVAIVVNMLHGICYAFFFATVYIFIDEFFPRDIRSSAQGLFNFVILGAAPFVSNFISGTLGELYHRDVRPTAAFVAGPAATGQLGPVYNLPPKAGFQEIFMYPCAVALIASVLLLLLFHPHRKPDEVTPQPPAMGE